MSLENLTRYQGGELARRFYQSEQDRPHTKGALYQLASDLGIEEKAKGFIEGTMTDEKGIATAAETYADKYQKALGLLTTDEFLTNYSEILTDYLNDKESKKVRAEFEKFSGETFKKINDKFTTSLYILQGKDIYDFPEDVKKDAENNLQRYRGILNIMEGLENIKFENLRPNAVKRTQKEDLKNRVKEL